MVLAEMVAAGDIVSPNEMQQVDGLGLLPLRIDGVQLDARRRDRPRRAARAAHRHPAAWSPRTSAPELTRFDEALHGVRDDVDRMLEAHDMQSGEQREILETFRMFADDRGWIERMREAIALRPHRRGRACSAPSTTCARGSASRPIPIIRERLSDLRISPTACCCA